MQLQPDSKRHREAYCHFLVDCLVKTLPYERGSSWVRNHVSLPMGSQNWVSEFPKQSPLSKENKVKWMSVPSSLGSGLLGWSLLYPAPPFPLCFPLYHCSTNSRSFYLIHWWVFYKDFPFAVVYLRAWGGTTLTYNDSGTLSPTFTNSRWAYFA